MATLQEEEGMGDGMDEVKTGEGGGVVNSTVIVVDGGVGYLACEVLSKRSISA